MTVETDYAIRLLTIDNSTWTPVTSPFPCSSWSLRCETDDILERSDPANADSQDTLPEGAQEYVTGLPVRWAPTNPFIYLQAKTNASAVVILKFVK